jgi:hypothetical protein
LNLRRSSRAFLYVFNSQRFWASRFEPGRERDFIFEKRNCKEARDWRTLYRLTNSAHSPPGLQNRKRVWGLINRLPKILRLQLADAAELPHFKSGDTDLRWMKVTGELISDEDPDWRQEFYEGCRLFDQQCVAVPEDLFRLAFSTIRVGDEEYLTGMRLISKNGSDTCLGYRAEGDERFLDITTLKGFITAVGSRGIRGVQVITDDLCGSNWVGCPNDSPITKRLVGTGSIVALRAGFDVSKPLSNFLFVLTLISSRLEVALGFQAGWSLGSRTSLTSRRSSDCGEDAITGQRTLVSRST